MHSIAYDQPPSFFLVFAIFNEANFCLDWTSTKDWVERIGEASCLKNLCAVPELYIGPWDQEIICKLYTGVSKLGGEQEGYVVRTVDGFPFDESDSHLAKFVRMGHIQTSDRWKSSAVVPNRIKG